MINWEKIGFPMNKLVNWVKAIILCLNINHKLIIKLVLTIFRKIQRILTEIANFWIS